jgi:hypothetical protein
MSEVYERISAVAFIIGLICLTIVAIGIMTPITKARSEGPLSAFPLHSTKGWEDLWEITLKGNKDQELSNTNWN